MKNYSTEAYYAYARRMLEGEAGKANLPDKSDDPQFKKMIIGASAGGVGAVACLKYLDNAFSMTTLSDTISKFSGYASDISAQAATAAKHNGAGMPSIWEKVLGVFKGLIAKALGWVQSFCARIVKAFPGLSKPIFGPSTPGNMTTPIIGSRVPTYGSVLCMALVGAAVGAVIYRIYKFIKNRRKKTESVAAFNARKNREYKAILVETVAFFDNLDRLTEARGDDLTRTVYGGRITNPGYDKTERMFQASKDNAAYQQRLQAAKRAGIDAGEKARLAAADKVKAAGNPNGYVSTSSLREPAKSVTKAGTKATTTAAKEAPAKAEGFLASMKERLTTMWTSVKTWCTNNPMLATMVGICAALVACWYGVKKYKESQAKKTGAAQTQS